MVRYCCGLVSVVHICVRITDALNYRHQTLTYNKRCYILEVTYIFNLYVSISDLFHWQFLLWYFQYFKCFPMCSFSKNFTYIFPVFFFYISSMYIPYLYHFPFSIFFMYISNLYILYHFQVYFQCIHFQSLTNIFVIVHLQCLLLTFLTCTFFVIFRYISNAYISSL